MRSSFTAAATAALVGLSLALAAPGTSTASASGNVPSAAPAPAAPSVSIRVTGRGVSTYPDFEPDTSRYGVLTSDGSTGKVDVTVTGAADIRVNGRPSGRTTRVTGLERGDEISVIADGRPYAFVYLPPEFPELTTTVDEPGQTDGLVGLTLNRFRTQGTPGFAVVVDDNGVPAYLLNTDDPPTDLRVQPNGSYSYAANLRNPSGYDIVELNRRFGEVRRHRLRGDITHTDNHDSVLLPDGTSILGAYEVDPDTGLVDTVIQEISPAGNVVFEWNSRDDLLDESVFPYEDGPQNFRGDYAHFNAIWPTADGHLLISLRHTSSVIKLARRASGDFRAGDVMWRFGGRNSDFELLDDPFPGGPCAQHTASELPNGNILIFDNGSSEAPFAGGALCIDPADPGGDPVARAFTRITEYALDEEAGEATLVSSWDADFLGIFAGGAYRDDNGNTIAGFAGTAEALAIELDPDQNIIWRLEHQVDDPNVTEPYQTYRATRFPAVDDFDRIAPEIAMKNGIRLVRGQRASAKPTCTDVGGSSLATCEVRGLSTAKVGTRKFQVRATDGADNVTSQRFRYTVAPNRYRPSALIKPKPRGRFASRVKRITLGNDTVKAVVKVTNRGNSPDRFRIRAGTGRKGWQARYRVGKRNVTGKVSGRGLRTKLVPAGRSMRLKVTVRRTSAVQNQENWTQRIRARSIRGKARDAVVQRLIARG